MVLRAIFLVFLYALVIISPADTWLPTGHTANPPNRCVIYRLTGDFNCCRQWDETLNAIRADRGD